MSNEVSIPNVEVIENGQQVSPERMDPAVMSFIMQTVSASQLTKLRKLEESKIPIKTKPIRITVPDTVTRVDLSDPWISFSLINDGLNGVTVWVNDEQDPLEEGMIASLEMHTCDMKFPVIETIFLKSQAGTTNAVRIYGKVGRKSNQGGVDAI